ncbi:MAG: type I secretion system permease/ATPase [Hyphomicrobium sp.]
MARRKDQDRDDERARMTAAMRRLEDLLRDPAATVSSKATRKGRLDRAIVDDEPSDNSSAGDIGNEEWPHPDAGEAHLIGNGDAVEEAATETKRSKRHVWTSKADAGPKAPPPRPHAVAPTIRRPAAAGQAPTEPPRFRKILNALISRLFGVRDGEVKDALAASRGAIRALIAFSAVISAAMLAGPLYVMLVIDRALPSGSAQTLAIQASAVAAIYLVIGLLDLARTRIVARIGAEVEMRLASSAFEAGLRRSIDRPAGPAALRGFESVRQFFAGAAPVAALNVLWTPVAVMALAALDWRLGAAGAVSALTLAGLAWLGARRVKRLLGEADDAAELGLEIADAGQRNGDVVAALGMAGAYRARWQDVNAEGVSWRLLAADRLGGASVAVAAARRVLQVVIFAGAAYLAMSSSITVGGAVAAAALSGLALSPIDRFVACWRDIVACQDGFAKIEEALSYAAPNNSHSGLPPPKGALEAQNVRVAAPHARNVILSGVAFAMSPGQSMAILGPSASGKTTLARAIAGLLPPMSGAMLLDGAPLDQRHPDDLGRHVGYAPQNVELFAGTIADNIARFRPDIDDRAIIAAAKQAHAHEMILSLPKGYETELGDGGAPLSCGQRERIALARALFGAPALIVLDEPGSSLDSAGVEALSAALAGMKSRGQTVVIVSRDEAAAADVDLVLLLDAGRQRAFGRRDDIFKTFKGDAALTAAIGEPSSLMRSPRAARA